jgi:hypothetical protein
MPLFTATRSALRRPLVVAAVLALTPLGLSAGLPTAIAALPTRTPPVLQRGSKNVTADALPTAQVDGVVYKQVIAGNTVFAGGNFASARPAGVAKGGAGTVKRYGLMSYNIRTGKMTSFAPKLTGTAKAGEPTEVRALALSPNKKILYVGGNFKAVGGKDRPFFAAFTVATGKLRSLRAAPSSQVRAIAATDRTIYLGGYFARVAGKTRSHAAAVSASTGSLLRWNPKADAAVEALLVNPGKTRVIIGGHFSTLGGHVARGMGAVTTVAGAVRTWKVNTKVKDYGSNSAILDLTADKDTVYGAGYGYQAGNFEGVFAASSKVGNLRWLQDCHGDQYGVVPIGNLVYSVGHAHFCKNIGGFAERTPQRTLVVSKTARGTIAHNSQGGGSNYHDWAGLPAPSIVNWFPVLNTANVSGSNQGAWSIRGTSSYVVLGGEFTTVNGKAQQGLVRFTTPANKAPENIGPAASAAEMTPAVVSSNNTGRTLSWRANYDRDDKKLTYAVLRNGHFLTPFVRSSTFYNRPQITWKDKKAKPGVRYSYQIYVRDHDGNSRRSVKITSNG